MQANIKINYFHMSAKMNAKTQSSMPSLNFSPLTARPHVRPTHTTWTSFTTEPPLLLDPVRKELGADARVAQDLV